MSTATAPFPNENWAPRFFTLWAGQALSLLGIQLWFRVARITCALLGAAGFLIHEVMKMEEEKRGLAGEHS